GVPIEEPPNFWTSSGLVTDSGSALNIALPRQPFRQEDGALARAELGVVREDNVLDAPERRLVAHATDGDRHTVARVAVAARLRTEGIGGDLQQAIRRRGKTFESIDAKPLHRGGGGPRIDRTLGADEDGFQVAVGDVDPCAGTGDREWRRLAPVTQDLLRLALDLLLLARDEGDDVVDDVEGQDPALAARARDRLKRGHHHGAHAEGVVQRLERDGQAGGRAVGDGRDEAAPAARAAPGEPPAGTGWVAQRVAERFSRRALGGADRGHTEPWVPLERGQHLLPREAGGSEHAYPHTSPP